MSVLTDPPKPSFRLSQLLYDTRYRSLTIQVFALLLIVALIAFLVLNVITNLHQIGKDIDFGFLGVRAGYDINQMLIPYDSSMTHGRAALVGICNTLLVAAMGCVTATVIGVLAGVLRLSKNKIVAFLMSVYVESFRNVPLVLWILLVYAVLTESTPQPRDFVEGGTASMWFLDTIAVTNRGVFVPMPVFGSGALVLLGVFVASLIGIFGFRSYAKGLQQNTGRILPVFWVSVGLLLLPVIATYLVMSNFWVGATLTLVNLVTLAILILVFQVVRQKLGSAGWATLVAAIAAYAAAHLWAGGVAPVLTGAAAFAGLPTTGSGFGILGSWLVDIAGNLRGWFGALSPRYPFITGIDLGIGKLIQGVLQTVPISNASLIDPANWTPPVTFSIPALGGFNFDGGLQVRNSLIALWLALSLYTGAFIAEGVRAGILAISKGQSEAAFALGLRPGRTMSLVILPQALRVIIPPLISQYLNLTKNSSLAIAVSYMDVRATLGGITINQTGRELEGILLLGGFYLFVSIVISVGMNAYNRSKILKER